MLIAEGHYVGDKKHGLWREYFDSGELMIEESFIEGVPNGLYVTFHRPAQAVPLEVLPHL